MTYWHFMPLGDECLLVREKLEGALALLAEHEPRQLGFLRTLTAGLIVMDHPMLAGSWVPVPRLIRLTHTYLHDEATTAERVATTIVHELAHARLGARGFAYSAPYRHRIEAICYRAEAAFAWRLPHGQSLAEEYEALAADAIRDGPDSWSQQAQMERDVRALEILEAPQWVVRGFRRLWARRSA